ncbi:MAG: OsmC family peroxiredoxin [Kofleriaceae bacterium]|nr:OsmC family peroxiredoxin [Kofleriaceae bacterium]
MDRGAICIWNDPRTDAGMLTTDSGALTNTPISPHARFDLEAVPTASTPEELLAAAYAGCFTMMLAQHLDAAGYHPMSLRTEARVMLIKPSGYWEIPGVRIHCSAIVPGISAQEFLAICHEAKQSGPIAQAMRAELTLTVSLVPLPHQEPIYAPAPA